MSIAKRSITSISWNVIANVVQIAVGFVRSILLARLLPVETFGIYGWAGSVIAIAAVLANFGMGAAFMHRSPETEDEDQAAAVHFTLQMIFSLTWAVVLVGGAMLFTQGNTRTALIVLGIISAASQLMLTPRLILARRVVHRRLAFLQIATIVLSTAVAVVLAWRGVTLWALLSTDLVALALNVIAFYVWRPVWRPRLTWSPGAMRYFLGFGSRNFLAIILLRALDRVDDIWTGTYLGEASMGFYSRAYTFATYPRKLVAAPINLVTVGTYAELNGDRPRLSRAFFRTNAFLVRSGFLLAGLLALIAPEFIRLLLGSKWLPMLDAFRLMLVFTLMDPMKIAIGDLFVAVGKPEKVVRVRFIQLAIMITGLFLLGPRFGIAGVALAVDLMLVFGIGILLWQARTYVDFSFTRLFGAPGVAFISGMVLARGAIILPGVLGSDLRTFFVKFLIFSVIYCATLLILERNELLEVVRIFESYWKQSAREK